MPPVSLLPIYKCTFYVMLPAFFFLVEYFYYFGGIILCVFSFTDYCFILKCYFLLFQTHNKNISWERTRLVINIIKFISYY